MKNIPEEGMRVHVYSEDKTKDLGLGTIEKVKPLHIMGAGLNISTTFPSSIVLDSGEVIDGLRCWWISVEREKEILKQKGINEMNNIEKIEEAIGAFINGIAICIKRLLAYNHAIKTIDRKVYDERIEEEISLLEEMYSNPLFAQLFDTFTWSDICSGRNKHKRKNSILTDTERSIANFYLIWKEDENKSLDNSAVE